MAVIVISTVKIICEHHTHLDDRIERFTFDAKKVDLVEGRRVHDSGLAVLDISDTGRIRCLEVDGDLEVVLFLHNEVIMIKKNPKKLGYNGLR